MGWFRNLFKSHAQKRVEARREEENAWRSAYRAAGPGPASPDVQPVPKSADLPKGPDKDDKNDPPLSEAS